jgi:hypothetical protein
MRTLENLNKRVAELKGKGEITYVAGKTVSDMLTAEPKTCKKIDFISVRTELSKKGNLYILTAEPGRETIEEAIAGFLAEEARRERQHAFFNEVVELNNIKGKIEHIERIVNDPRIARIKVILKKIKATDDKKYMVNLLVDGLTGFTCCEKDYIKENLI